MTGFEAVLFWTAIFLFAFFSLKKENRRIVLAAMGALFLWMVVLLVIEFGGWLSIVIALLSVPVGIVVLGLLAFALDCLELKIRSRNRPTFKTYVPTDEERKKAEDDYNLPF